MTTTKFQPQLCLHDDLTRLTFCLTESRGRKKLTRKAEADRCFSTPMHYPALTLAPTCGANGASQVFIDTGAVVYARILHGFCGIVYV